MSHERPDCCQLGLERVGKANDSGCEGTDEDVFERVGEILYRGFEGPDETFVHGVEHGDSGFEDAEETFVRGVIAVEGQKIVVFVINNVQVVQVVLIIAVAGLGVGLICRRRVKLLVAEKDGDDEAGQTEQGRQNGERDLER